MPSAAILNKKHNRETPINNTTFNIKIINYSINNNIYNTNNTIFYINTFNYSKNNNIYNANNTIFNINTFNYNKQ